MMEETLLVCLLALFIGNVQPGHLPNCTIKTVDGIDYYDIPNLRFLRIDPAGFFIAFEDVRGWKNITVHMNNNKPIRVGDKGHYVTQLTYDEFFKNKTEWGFIEYNRRVRGDDVLYMWINVTDYKRRVDCYLLEPFTSDKYVNFPYLPYLTEMVFMNDDWQTITQTHRPAYESLVNEIDSDASIGQYLREHNIDSRLY